MSIQKNSSSDHTPNTVGQQREGKLSKVAKRLPARSKENFLLLALLVLGISGFLYILSLPIDKSEEMSLFNKIFYPIQGKSLTKDHIASGLVEVVGDMKTNSEITFLFKNLLNKGDYVIRFGDQKSEVVSSASISHFYTDPGNYKVQLLKAVGSEEIVVHSEYLVID